MGAHGRGGSEEGRVAQVIGILLLTIAVIGLLFVALWVDFTVRQREAVGVKVVGPPPKIWKHPFSRAVDWIGEHMGWDR